MFEKSLYDLIRGLRKHKGNERAYIQDSIRECRREIKTQDMDLKSTALLKLTYLEMYGHDMSWASFNVLEVMSSQKPPQKRVAYLAAVQSFRSDTEVLMLVENQLKKDLGSPMAPIISLPLAAIPHVINVSMANSLLADLIPRLSHSNPTIRKKTIVTLYRLALVYPETLRPAWPKIKERLLDESEDSSVTAAVVNVVCELGWRRPHDFLPLAPRLFDLLVEGNSNWMAIKIIKLFATLTPLEPRLVKKLLAPLTNIIKTTPAMSLLYECINGIIVSGILTTASGSTEGDEIARLCVSKLRSMLAVEGDPNLRYVALLAFERIVEHHPYLVSLHEDAILECIDDKDISIRLRALDLASSMVSPQNLTPIVERLMRQLEASNLAAQSDDAIYDRGAQNGVEPYADSDEDAGESIKPQQAKPENDAELPDEYRINVIRKILQMSSANNYSNINDFDWYIGILVNLIRQVPVQKSQNNDGDNSNEPDVALSLGEELRNVAVRVKSSRSEAVRAAELLLRSTFAFKSQGSDRMASARALGAAAWIAGEFAVFLDDRDACLDAIVSPHVSSLPTDTLTIFIRSAMKIFSSMAGDIDRHWDREWNTMITLVMAKMIRFLDMFTSHPSLEIQEAAVEFAELLRLASEANKSQEQGDGEADPTSPPLLLSSAIPSLFTGADINPVAPDAQGKVPIPEELALDEPINEHLNLLLQAPNTLTEVADNPDFYDYYYRKPQPETPVLQPAANRLLVPDEPLSYQQGGKSHEDLELAARKRAERQAYLRDDPFYISGRENSGTATPVHDILRATNGDELDVDSIPIMELDLGEDMDHRPQSNRSSLTTKTQQQKTRRKIDILSDESIDRPAADKHSSAQGANATNGIKSTKSASRSLLQVDSSGLGSLSLEQRSDAFGKRSQLDVERQEAEDAEMDQAMKEVERLRLEMQRAQERIQAKSETTVVKKKKKKKERNGEQEAETSTNLHHNNQTPGSPDTQDINVAENAGIKKEKKTRKTSSIDNVGTGVTNVDNDQHASKPRKKKKKRREADVEESSTGL